MLNIFKKKSFVDETHALHVEIDRKKKAIYIQDIDEMRAGIINPYRLQSAEVNLWTSIAKNFKVNPYEYGVKCSDCDKKFKVEGAPLCSEVEISVNYYNTTSIQAILSFIASGKNSEAFEHLLVYIANLTDSVRFLELSELDKVQKIKKGRWCRMYENFHFNKGIRNFILHELVKTRYIQKSTKKDLNKEFTLLYARCRDFYNKEKGLPKST